MLTGQWHIVTMEYMDPSDGWRRLAHVSDISPNMYGGARALNGHWYMVTMECLDPTDGWTRLDRVEDNICSRSFAALERDMQTMHSTGFAHDDMRTLNIYCRQ